MRDPLREGLLFAFLAWAGAWLLRLGWNGPPLPLSFDLFHLYAAGALGYYSVRLWMRSR